MTVSAKGDKRADGLSVGNPCDERKILETQANQRAQKLELIDQLEAGIGHEIRTPTQHVDDIKWSGIVVIIVLTSRVEAENTNRKEKQQWYIFQHIRKANRIL